jgi:Flp pilus assembly protein CpaB
VTLALSAEDLAKVVLAARIGTITFAIRNPVDDVAQSPSRAELSTLLGDLPASAPGPVRNSAQRHQSPAGIPFYAGRERSTLHAP